MHQQTTLNIDINQYLKEKRELINDHIKHLLSDEKKYSEPKVLWDAIKYSSLDGGKRLRGIFCLATYESILEIDKEKEEKKYDCLTVASTLEIIHAMSLIHDDLPCMDNDDLRRGKPSCHKAFGEANALLAGDSMISLAFYFISEACKKISGEIKINLIKELTETISFGLIPGQVLDLMEYKEEINSELIDNIYLNKTAKLIKSSIVCGALVSLDNNKKYSDKENLIQKLNTCGINMGIAFQIIDDILDITSNTETLGKTAGKDLKQNKKTYPSLIGIEKSKEKANILISETKNIFYNLGIRYEVLSQLADKIINRIK